MAIDGINGQQNSQGEVIASGSNVARISLEDNNQITPAPRSLSPVSLHPSEGQIERIENSGGPPPNRSATLTERGAYVATVALKRSVVHLTNAALGGGLPLAVLAAYSHGLPPAQRQSDGSYLPNPDHLPHFSALAVSGFFRGLGVGVGKEWVAKALEGFGGANLKISEPTDTRIKWLDSCLDACAFMTSAVILSFGTNVVKRFWEDQGIQNPSDEYVAAVMANNFSIAFAMAAIAGGTDLLVQDIGTALAKAMTPGAEYEWNAPDMTKVLNPFVKPRSDEAIESQTGFAVRCGIAALGTAWSQGSSALKLGIASEYASWIGAIGGAAGRVVQTTARNAFRDFAIARRDAGAATGETVADVRRTPTPSESVHVEEIELENLSPKDDTVDESLADVITQIHGDVLELDNALGEVGNQQEEETVATGSATPPVPTHLDAASLRELGANLLQLGRQAATLEEQTGEALEKSGQRLDQLIEAEGRLRDLEQSRDELGAEHTQGRENLAGLESALELRQDDLARLQDEYQTHDDALQGAQRRFDELSKGVENAESGYSDVLATYETLAQEVADLRRKIGEQDEPIRQLEARHEELLTQLASRQDTSSGKGIIDQDLQREAGMFVRGIERAHSIRDELVGQCEQVEFRLTEQTQRRDAAHTGLEQLRTERRRFETTDLTQLAANRDLAKQALETAEGDVADAGETVAAARTELPQQQGGFDAIDTAIADQRALVDQCQSALRTARETSNALNDTYLTALAAYRSTKTLVLAMAGAGGGSV